MSQNKKILIGDNYPKSVNEDITGPVVIPPTEGVFTFDRTDITFDMIARTFDEI